MDILSNFDVANDLNVTGNLTLAGGAPVEIAGADATLPTESTPFLTTMNAPQKTFRAGFDSAVASGLDTNHFTAVKVGSGMGASQAAGSALLTSGTTTHSESIYRSVSSFAGNMTMRYSTILSQRIANQSFFIELVDVIGDTLAYVVNSATSITVTIPDNPFTSANVGQSMYVGALTLAACPSGRYAIASVSGDDVTFTVASFPASGSGTCSLFGWNFQHVVYTSTTATNVLYDAGRNGYSSGDTTATINTTASPGHVGTISIRDATGGYFDQLSASSTTLECIQRASRVRNVPEDITQLYLQIRMLNGAVAPASTTTWTVGFLEVENFVAQQVSLVGVAPMSMNAGLTVSVANTPAVTMTGTTITSVVPGVAATSLGKAEDAAHATGDTGVMALGVRSAAPVDRSAGPTDGDYEPFATNEVGAVWVSVTPSANGGATTMNASSSDGATALTSTVQAIKASAGTLKGYYIYNPNATAQFVQFYNVAFGSVTVGTTNPMFMLTIPATGAANLWMTDGIAFSTAMSWAATSTAGGNGAPTTALDATAWYK